MPRLTDIQKLSKYAAVLLLGQLLWSGCSEDGNSSFMEIEPQVNSVAVIDRGILAGGQWRAIFFDITGDMVQPSVHSNWTVITRELFIDMYLFRASDYDPGLPPNTQPKAFWKSVPDVGPIYGPRRGSQVTLNPCVYNTETPPQCRPEGQWVVVFYNDNQPIPAKRATYSANVSVRFFK
jgi:hypothetical protein